MQSWTNVKIYRKQQFWRYFIIGITILCLAGRSDRSWPIYFNQIRSSQKKRSNTTHKIGQPVTFSLKYNPNGPSQNKPTSLIHLLWQGDNPHLTNIMIITSTTVDCSSTTYISDVFMTCSFTTCLAPAALALLEILSPATTASILSSTASTATFFAGLLSCGEDHNWSMAHDTKINVKGKCILNCLFLPSLYWQYQLPWQSAFCRRVEL